METVTVGLGDRAYDILIGSGSLPALGEAVAGAGLRGSCLVVTNPTVGNLYLEPARASLERAGFATGVSQVPDGERYKTTRWIGHIYDHLLESGIDRGGFVVALGGGVIGDMAGFAAATWLRGIPFVQVPTTLVAQVDSSVGGKTGVNHPKGKNLIGAFHQPRLVYMDMDVLATLPRRELLAGLAEVVKYGVIEDQAFFDFLAAHADEALALRPDVLARVVRRCCEIKARVVAEDEREVSGRRAILNYGHTVGHAVEAVTRYRRFKHGEAVAIGMVAAARIAVREGRLKEPEAKAQRDLLARLGLPTEIPPQLDRRALAEAMTHDKKATQGKVRMILADRIGHVDMVSFTESEVATHLAQL